MEGKAKEKNINTNKQPNPIKSVGLPQLSNMGDSVAGDTDQKTPTTLSLMTAYTKPSVFDFDLPTLAKPSNRPDYHGLSGPAV